MSHSLNEAIYPPGHAAAKGRPVPNPMHLASIEKEAGVKAAIEFVMTKQNLPYPAAAKLVHEKGEKFYLAQRDAVVNEAAAAQANSLRPGEQVVDVEATKVQPKIVASGKK